MASEPVVIGDTIEWDLTVLVDGAVFNLTGATVTITFISPARTATSFDMAIVSAAAGTATYTNLTGLFTATGLWGRSYRVVKPSASIVLESAEVPFAVEKSLSALVVP